MVLWIAVAVIVVAGVVLWLVLKGADKKEKAHQDALWGTGDKGKAGEHGKKGEHGKP